MFAYLTCYVTLTVSEIPMLYILIIRHNESLIHIFKKNSSQSIFHFFFFLTHKQDLILSITPVSHKSRKPTALKISCSDHHRVQLVSFPQIIKLFQTKRSKIAMRITCWLYAMKEPLPTFNQFSIKHLFSMTYSLFQLRIVIWWSL